VPLEFIFLEQGKKIRLKTKNTIAVDLTTIAACEEALMKITLSF